MWFCTVPFQGSDTAGAIREGERAECAGRAVNCRSDDRFGVGVGGGTVPAPFDEGALPRSQVGVVQCVLRGAPEFVFLETDP